MQDFDYWQSKKLHYVTKSFFKEGRKTVLPYCLLCSNYHPHQKFDDIHNDSKPKNLLISVSFGCKNVCSSSRVPDNSYAIISNVI